MDEIYRRRRRAHRASSEGTETSTGVVTWHPDTPPPPTSFPDEVNLLLTRDEAEFLRDRIVAEHRPRLLGWLALHPEKTDVAFPWHHPSAERMPSEHRHTLYHARLFSKVMNGAPILYNLMLSEKAKFDELVKEYRERFHDWAESLDGEEVADWPLLDLFATARKQGGHTISSQTQELVRQWVQLVRKDPDAIPELAQARNLIRHREMLLKGPHSLFQNRRALEERYAGGLGLGRLNYRWPDVQILLNDLHDGLTGK